MSAEASGVVAFTDFNRVQASVPFPKRLEAFMSGKLGQKPSVHGAEKEFKDLVQQTPPLAAVRKFPSKITYQSHCGELCKREAGAAMLDFQQRIVEQWVSLVGTHAPRQRIALVSVLEVVLAFEVWGSVANDI